MYRFSVAYSHRHHISEMAKSSFWDAFIQLEMCGEKLFFLSSFQKEGVSSIPTSNYVLYHFSCIIPVIICNSLFSQLHKVVVGKMMLQVCCEWPASFCIFLRQSATGVQNQKRDPNLDWHNQSGEIRRRRQVHKMSCHRWYLLPPLACPARQIYQPLKNINTSGLSGCQYCPIFWLGLILLRI